MNQIQLRSRLAKTNQYALLAFAFSLSFPVAIVRLTLAFWIVSCLFNLKKISLSSLKKVHFVPLFLLLFLAMGRLFTSLLHGDSLVLLALFADTQIPLVVLPILLLFQGTESFKFTGVLKAYVVGCVTSCFVATVYYFLFRFSFIQETIAIPIFSSNLAFSISTEIGLFQGYITEYYKHRAGLGACLSMGIACMIYLLKQKNFQKPLEKVCIGFTSFILIVVLYATGSRSGLISLALVLVIGSVYLFWKRKIILIGVFSGLFVLLVGISSLKTTRPLMVTEISSMDYQKIKKMDPRFSIWEACVDIIKVHPAVGIGYSHVRSGLLAKYEEKKMELELAAKFDSHNQFLQFVLESGIWAGIVYFFILLPVFFRNKIWYISMVFSSTMIIYSMFEDSLIILNGMSFFAFFMALMFLKQKQLS